MIEQTACRRCRTQKLRCDRGQPQCARCVRVDADCTYPQPPDRKLIAARRRPPKKAVRTCSVHESKVTDLEQKLLIDLYFKFVIKAHLVYHRPSFEAACQQGSVPHHSLLAVYALALNFLDPETTHSAAYRQQLQRLGDLRKLAEEFALTAGKEVLRDMDEPSIERFQTCHNLGYFWFSRGDTHKNATFTGIAYRASRSRLMGSAPVSWLDGELARRSFWCSYIQACVNSDDYVTGSACDSLALETALPVSDLAYHAGTPEPTVTLAEMLDKDRPHGTFSIWAHFFSILALWTTIRDHVVSRRKSNTNQILYDTLLLQQDLDNWTNNLPSQFTYCKKNLFCMIYTGDQQIFTTTHAISHYCRLALQSSLVPSFTDSAPKDLSLDAIKISTEATIRNAQNLTELANDLITLECDFAQLPPYLGYCMYVAGSIHLTMINSMALGENSRKQLSLALAVLQGMRPFWTIVEHLWNRLLEKCEEQVSQGCLASDALPMDMVKPMTTYSLTKLKNEGSMVDVKAVLDQISPKSTQDEVVDQQLLDMFQPEQFDFNGLANTFGEDWWQVDAGAFPTMPDIVGFL